MNTKTKLLAFHDDPAIKAKYIARVKAHQDDSHINGELAIAAACYALAEDCRESTKDHSMPAFWPFEEAAWKPCPNDRQKELVKAGALIVAEIERIQRRAKNTITTYFTCPYCGANDSIPPYTGLTYECGYVRGDSDNSPASRSELCRERQARKKAKPQERTNLLMIGTCFEGLPLPPVSLVADPFNRAWRELLDGETYVEGEPVYSFSRLSWHSVEGLSGVGYRAYKDEFTAFTAFTTRPLPKEVQS